MTTLSKLANFQTDFFNSSFFITGGIWPFMTAIKPSEDIRGEIETILRVVFGECSAS